MTRICLIPKVSGVGGMVSFQVKLSAGLAARGMNVCYDLAEAPYDAVLVIGGTRQLAALRRVKRRGVRILQRLNGINWIHKRRRTGWRHYLRAEYGNRVLAFIRGFVADQVVYQSDFARGWWEDWFGPTRVANTIIHNGVDLQMYSPSATEVAITKFRLLVVEGSMGGGYDMGLVWAVQLAELLAAKNLPIELMIVGKVSPEHQAQWQTHSRVPILWAGTVPGEQIPDIDRSAHLLFAADLHPACPNAVIEALACGLPVVSFATGALPELVTGDSGRVVPYGGNAWKIDPPDLPALAAASAEILANPPHFRKAARARAEEAFGLDLMVEKYLKALLE